jgi:hypothetical protein
MSLSVLEALLLPLVVDPHTWLTPTWQILEPGTWIIFGVISFPVYSMFIGWFVGSPRNFKTSFLGFGTFVSFIVGLWGGLFVVTMLIGFLFFW